MYILRFHQSKEKRIMCSLIGVVIFFTKSHCAIHSTTTPAGSALLR